MPQNKDGVNYLTQTALLEQGWTKSMISKLLPEPITKINPVYKSASPMRLWSENDVATAEKTEEFADLLQKAQKRSAKAKQIAIRKAEQLMYEMTELVRQLSIPKLSDKKLRRKTIQSKYNFAAFRGANYGQYEENDFENADENTMRRWIVNYIRHELIDYDMDLEKYKGRIGIVKAYPEFKIAVLKRIAEVYPNYADECENQIERAKNPILYQTT